MRVTSLGIQKFRSFEKLKPINIGAINVLIGANNSGKSSILRALYLMQDGAGSGMPDVRSGAGTAHIQIGLIDVSGTAWGSLGTGTVDIVLQSPDRRGGNMQLSFTNSPNSRQELRPLPAAEPNHFIVPYLSKRKTSGYAENVSSQLAMQVMPSMSNLSAKLSRISNPSFPGYEKYSKTCIDILGFLVTAIPSESGQRPGIYLPNRETLTIDQMGEGVPNIVALLADLAISEGKIFLIEEPENDLHPKALKALLELIIESSKSNQFIVSTHSNIVLQYLGATTNSYVYYVDSESGKIPVTAKVRAIDQTPQARLEVLRDLGYSFSDFDLWDGWLILEEASAERLIRDYLIPWFTPKLSRIRTLSTNGAGNVSPTFEDFNRLVRFTHLEKAYEGAAWVRADGDPAGKDIIQKLRESYTNWPPGSFESFLQPQFEHYYPAHFKRQITETLKIVEKQERRKAKRTLLKQVMQWLDEDIERGRHALGESAKDVIEQLKKIEDQISDRFKKS